MEEELRTGKREKGHEKKYATYFNVTKTPVRGIKIELKQEKIDGKQCQQLNTTTRPLTSTPITNIHSVEMLNKCAFFTR